MLSRSFAAALSHLPLSATKLVTNPFEIVLGYHQVIIACYRVCVVASDLLRKDRDQHENLCTISWSHGLEREPKNPLICGSQWYAQGRARSYYGSPSNSSSTAFKNCNIYKVQNHAENPTCWTQKGHSRAHAAFGPSSFPVPSSNDP